MLLKIYQKMRLSDYDILQKHEENRIGNLNAFISKIQQNL